MEQFKKMLVEYRKQHALTRKEMADLLYVSESLIGMYERGERNISLEVGNALCELAGKELRFSITYRKKETIPNHQQVFCTLEETFLDWIHLGNDNGRGIHRMMKTIINLKGMLVTVLIDEGGLYAFKKDGNHLKLNEAQYHELLDNDPTPYIEPFAVYDEEKEVIDLVNDMPFEEQTNRKLLACFQTFLTIVIAE